MPLPPMLQTDFNHSDLLIDFIGSPRTMSTKLPFTLTRPPFIFLSSQFPEYGLIKDACVKCLSDLLTKIRSHPGDKNIAHDNL